MVGGRWGVKGVRLCCKICVVNCIIVVIVFWDVLMVRRWDL